LVQGKRRGGPDWIRIAVPRSASRKKNRKAKKSWKRCNFKRRRKAIKSGGGKAKKRAG